jgi:hypothetical protein
MMEADSTAPALTQEFSGACWESVTLARELNFLIDMLAKAEPNYGSSAARYVVEHLRALRPAWTVSGGQRVPALQLFADLADRLANAAAQCGFLQSATDKLDPDRSNALAFGDLLARELGIKVENWPPASTTFVPREEPSALDRVLEDLRRDDP